MRAVLMASPMPTHLAAMLPLAWALRAAGHQVAVLGRPNLVATATAAGLATFSVGAAFDDVAQRRERPAGARPLRRPGERVKPPIEKLAAGWRARVDEVLDDTVRVVRRWRPDLLIADPLEFTAQIVAGVCRVPLVQHRWGIDVISGKILGAADEALRDILLRVGLGPALPRPAIVLDPSPPSLRAPDLPAADSIRYVPSNGVGLMPAWVSRPRAARRVCVTFGSRTLAATGPAVLPTVLAAVAELPDVEVIATVPPDERDGLGRLSASVRVVDPVPLHLFLDTCSAVVHHGGAGTTLTALLAGLPQLVLPQAPPQVLTGERIEAAGIGHSMDDVSSQADPILLRRHLSALVDSPRPRREAAQVAAEMRQQRTPARWVPRLVALAEGRDGVDG